MLSSFLLLILDDSSISKLQEFDNITYIYNVYICRSSLCSNLLLICWWMLANFQVGTFCKQSAWRQQLQLMAVLPEQSWFWLCLCWLVSVEGKYRIPHGLHPLLPSLVIHSSLSFQSFTYSTILNVRYCTRLQGILLVWIKWWPNWSGMHSHDYGLIPDSVPL